MKRFIDNNGIFEIKVPATWKYFLMAEDVHTFQEYEAWKPDSFQLSIRKVKDSDEKNKLIHLLGYLPSIEIDDKDYRCYPDSQDDSFTTKAWTTLIGDEIILFSLTFSNNPDEILDNIPIDKKIEIVYSIIASFKLLENEERMQVLNSYRFEMFLQGIGASQLILKNAIENKAFIEATCVLASQIDSLLRIGIVLQKQILNETPL